MYPFYYEFELVKPVEDYLKQKDFTVKRRFGLVIAEQILSDLKKMLFYR